MSSVDRMILIGLAKARTPWLTVVAVDLTALGSVTLVVLISTIALCVLLLLKDRMGALQLVAASVGAGILTTTIKDYIDRARPEWSLHSSSRFRACLIPAATHWRPHPSI